MAPKVPKIARLTLDERSVVRRGPDVEHERQVAIFDLLEDNYFEPVGDHGGPYSLILGIVENRLTFDIRTDTDEKLGQIILALTPFRKIVKDYFEICDSYFQAIKKSTPSQIETIDMARRGVHNEGSALLEERLKGKIKLDHNTARRLFTLICVLHIRG
jgi:uncharacterized protein (UPF0262 family)